MLKDSRIFLNADAPWASSELDNVEPPVWSSHVTMMLSDAPFFICRRRCVVDSFSTAPVARLALASLRRPSWNVCAISKWKPLGSFPILFSFSTFEVPAFMSMTSFPNLLKLLFDSAEVAADSMDWIADPGVADSAFVPRTAAKRAADTSILASGTLMGVLKPDVPSSLLDWNGCSFVRCSTRGVKTCSHTLQRTSHTIVLPLAAFFTTARKGIARRVWHVGAGHCVGMSVRNGITVKPPIKGDPFRSTALQVSLHLHAVCPLRLEFRTS